MVFEIYIEPRTLNCLQNFHAVTCGRGREEEEAEKNLFGHNESLAGR